jgi:hypothetical protein
MQGAETWRLASNDKTIGVLPQGRFKADNGAALEVGYCSLPDILIGARSSTFLSSASPASLPEGAERGARQRCRDCA